MPLPLLLALAALFVLLLGIPATSRAEHASACSPEERAAQLAAAQEQVLALLGGLTTLENEADLAALAALGYDFYPHQQVSVRGMGWPVLDTVAPHDPAGGTPAVGRPTLLLYSPSGSHVTAPRDGFDFPYRFAGWAYLFPYDPQAHPRILSCLQVTDWFVHERGIHTFDDGGFDPMRPDGDDPKGAARGDDVPLPNQPGDFGHPRSWDAHLWVGKEVPAVSMTNPGPKLPGIDPDLGKAFFYPEASE